MLFNSLTFIGFFAVVLAVYHQLRQRGQNIFLLVASYVFYGAWDWRFTLLLLTSTVVDYGVGRRLDRTDRSRERRGLLLISLFTNLGILGFFKYFNFFVGSAATLLAGLGLSPNLPVLQVVLPVGISFYTFQTLSYSIDVYRRKLQPATDFVDFALFVSFFPQLVAGPIERATNLLPQIGRPRRVTRDDVRAGVNLALIGYFKKVVIADSLAPMVDLAFTGGEDLSSGLLLSGILAFSFQIYADFSGYTDIARGVARLLGFRIMENFNAPYLSRSVTEFWRRWHVSLSGWLRDYLYIPLGGNRRGRARTYANLLITMLLGGLWHGAAWHFVVWGLIHGIYLSVHKFICDGKPRLDSMPSGLMKGTMDVLRRIGTFALVSLAWVFFRSQDLGSALSFLGGIAALEGLSDFKTAVLVAGGLILSLDALQAGTGTHTWLMDRVRIRSLRYGLAEVLLLAVGAAAIAHSTAITPFIYFQF